MDMEQTANPTLKVVIPLYKEELSPVEQLALRNTMQRLAAHPVVFLHPEDTCFGRLSAIYPQASLLPVSPEWLGTKNGIAGYNRMMLSEAFYRLFDGTTYILICHADAWIFRDELTDWCGRGYDLVAAPWPLRPRYARFPLKQWIALCEGLFSSPRHLLRTQMYGRVGNGGLCLRRVETFARACRAYAGEAAYFLSRPGEGMYNEDIFWALVPRGFRYPPVEEALKFSFDIKPRVCYELSGYRLPMGCHGFMHKSRASFWKGFIPF